MLKKIIIKSSVTSVIKDILELYLVFYSFIVAFFKGEKLAARVQMLIKN